MHMKTKSKWSDGSPASYEYTTAGNWSRTARALVGASVTKLTEFPPNVR
jgi:hypothetical protein